MSKTASPFLLVAICLIVLFGSSSAQDQERDAARTPERVVEHHWAAFSSHDLEAVLSDYADDAIFIAPNQAVQGKDALRKMFASFFGTGPAGARPTAEPPAYDVKITADGEVGYEHWISNPGKPGSLEGTDAFVVRHGKILFHTVVALHPAGTP
jgi:uncharacterized protein (TIGR02246 family)